MGALFVPPPHLINRLKKSQCTPLFMLPYRQRNAGAVIHTHSPKAVMATLLWPGKEFRCTHLEMIKVRISLAHSFSSDHEVWFFFLFMLVGNLQSHVGPLFTIRWGIGCAHYRKYSVRKGFRGSNECDDAKISRHNGYTGASTWHLCLGRDLAKGKGSVSTADIQYSNEFLPPFFTV